MRNKKGTPSSKKLVIQSDGRCTVMVPAGEIPVIMGPNTDQVAAWMPILVMSVNFIRCGCPQAIVWSGWFKLTLLQAKIFGSSSDSWKTGFANAQGLCDRLNSAMEEIAPGNFGRFRAVIMGMEGAIQIYRSKP